MFERLKHKSTACNGEIIDLLESTDIHLLVPKGLHALHTKDNEISKAEIVTSGFKLWLKVEASFHTPGSVVNQVSYALEDVGIFCIRRCCTYFWKYQFSLKSLPLDIY